MDSQEVKKTHNGSNGSRKLGQWMTEKGVLFILVLISSLMVWLVTQIFAINTTIETMRLENIQRVHDLQMSNSVKIAELSTKIELITQTLSSIDGRLSAVCIELQVR